VWGVLVLGACSVVAGDLSPVPLGIVAVQPSGTRTNVTVAFSEPVSPGSGPGGAERAASYRIDSGIEVLAAKLAPDGRTVALATTELVPGVGYRLLVGHVRVRTPVPGAADSELAAAFVLPMRFEDGLIALYAFQGRSATTIQDSARVGRPLDLAIMSPDVVARIAGGIRITGRAVIRSYGPARKLIDACRVSGALSIEVWMKPANASQAGPARIVTLSQDPMARNFTLGQSASFYDVRLRTSATSRNGIPSLSTPPGTVVPQRVHVVYTRAADGMRKIFLDGELAARGRVEGDLAGWDENHKLALANELTLDRPWQGELYLVAIYARALSADEVRVNYKAGLGGPGG